LKSIGESDKDAKEFVAISQRLEQQCAQISFINEDKCDAQLLTICANTFARALNLPSMPTDASVLDKQIKELLSRGQEGQMQVCKNAVYFYGCLGQQQYHACISVEGLKSIGESDKDAQEFVEISKKLEKQCPLISFYQINAQCDMQLFTKCTDAFGKSVGLPSIPSDARVLLLQILTIEAKGEQGSIQVCLAEKNLRTCLGQQYDSCFSVAYLKSIGESDADAQAFVGLSNLLVKTCRQ